MEQTIFANIASVAKERGLSLKDVGKGAGVGENAIYRWKKMPPNIRTLEKVAKYLGVNVADLLK